MEFGAATTPGASLARPVASAQVDEGKGDECRHEESGGPDGPCQPAPAATRRSGARVGGSGHGAARQQISDPLREPGVGSSSGQPDPLAVAECVGNARGGLARLVDHDRHDEGLVVGLQARAVDGEFPLQAEIALAPPFGIRRNDGDEEMAVADLLSDRRIPGVAAAKLARVEPGFHAGIAQRRRQAQCVLGILRRVTDEDGLARIAHRPPATMAGMLHNARRTCDQDS
jgi:hypothetical protein